MKLPNLHYANKKESITSQRLGSHDFWQIANNVFNKGKSAIPPLFNSPEVLSSASDKPKLFAKNFSKNSNLDESDLDLSKMSGPDYIPVVVLKNCELEPSYILAELFNVSEGVLVSRLLEGLIGGPCI